MRLHNLRLSYEDLTIENLDAGFAQKCIVIILRPLCIGLVDLAGIMGERMASADGGSVPSGIGYGEGCPLSSRLGGLGQHCELPQLGPG